MSFATVAINNMYWQARCVYVSWSCNLPWVLVCVSRFMEIDIQSHGFYAQASTATFHDDVHNNSTHTTKCDQNLQFSFAYCCVLSTTTMLMMTTTHFHIDTISSFFLFFSFLLLLCKINTQANRCICGKNTLISCTVMMCRINN